MRKWIYTRATERNEERKGEEKEKGGREEKGGKEVKLEQPLLLGP